MGYLTSHFYFLGIHMSLMKKINEKNDGKDKLGETPSIIWIVELFLAFWLVFSYDVSEDRLIVVVIDNCNLFLYYIKQADSIFFFRLLVINYKRRRSVVRTSATLD